MKNISLKKKITIWSTFLMLLLTLIMLAIISFVGIALLENEGKDSLIELVNDNSKHVDKHLDEHAGEKEDEIKFYDDNVYYSIYDESFNLVDGSTPNNLEFNDDFEDGKLKTINLNGNEYYIYDKYHEDANLWGRGIVEVSELNEISQGILIVAIVALPIFILLTAVGVGMIMKKSFKPIDKMIDTMEKINESEDLSLRLNVEKGDPEILRLAKNFDSMLTGLEKSFDIEKQFTSDASHELRTPIAVIMAQCEYSLEEDANEEDRREALEVIHRQGERMSRLTNDLLRVSRLDFGIEKGSFEACDLSRLFAEVCLEQKLLKTKNIELSEHIEEGIYGKVDKEMMVRLLTNLITNSYKYGKNNGKIKVDFFRGENSEFKGIVNDEFAKGKIILSVIDDGIGIEEEHIDKIFNRFYQVEKARTGEELGSFGLGLAMVQQIAKAHGGKVFVSSKAGGGSQFVAAFDKKIIL